MRAKIPMQRYIVTKPVKDGYQYFDVADTRSEVYPYFTVASFSALHCKNAEWWANQVCNTLNSESGDMESATL